MSQQQQTTKLVEDMNIQIFQQLFVDENIQNNSSLESLKKLDLQMILKKLKTDRNQGINTNPAELEQRKQQFGTNEPKMAKEKSFIHCCLVSTQDFCIQILSLAAVLMFICGFFAEEPTEIFAQAFSVLLAVIAVVMIAGTTDWRKDQQYRELVKDAHGNNTVKCIRDGKETDINVSDLLVGDIIRVEPGSYIIVDGILLPRSDGQNINLEVDESSLTGISEMIIKKPMTKEEIQAMSLQDNCFLRSGSVVYQGSGKMLVLCVGQHTMLGKIKENIHDPEESSFLQSSSASFAKLMVLVGCFFSSCMLAILIYYDKSEVDEDGESLTSTSGIQKLLTSFLVAFMIIVFAVPEGLPLIITLSLANAMQELKKHGVQVRNLNSCTYLSGVNIICFDKTGTLTMNQITVSQYYTEHMLCKPNDEDCTKDLSKDTRDSIKDCIFSTNTATIEIETKKTTRADNQENENFLYAEISDLATTRRDADDENMENIKIEGNKIDSCLIQFLKNKFTGMSIKNERDYWGENDRIITRGLVAGQKPLVNYVVADNRMEDNKYRVYFKGMVENMFSKCKYMVRSKLEIDTGFCEIDNAMKNQIYDNIINCKSNTKLVCMGYKDIICEDKDNFNWEDCLFQDLTLIGFFSLHDEIRKKVDKSIAKFRDYDIDVKMMTGDVPKPSFFVASHIGIIDSKYEFDSPELQDQIIQGKVIEDMTEIIKVDTNKTSQKKEMQVVQDKYKGKFIETLKTFKILCNCSAEEKEIVVKQMIDQKGIVAYVGDGNNDVKALNNSSIGFAMGICGTAIAKESCNLILSNDDIRGIVHAIEWGRNVYLNIQRFIFLQLGFFIVSTILMVSSSLILEESPFAVLQIIWLSLIHDVFSSIALAFEKPIKDIGKLIPPIRSGQGMLNVYLIVMISSQVICQLLVSYFVLFYAPSIFNILPSDEYSINDLDSQFEPRQALHYTLVFHTTTILQLFAIINSRNLGHKEYLLIPEFFSNYFFWGILISCYVIQMSIVEFGGEYFKCAKLTFVQNFFCHFIGSITMVVYWVMKKILEVMKINFD